MSLEIWSVAASVGTFVVITATAIAAVLQLGHLRAANKVAYIQAFFHEFEGPELRVGFDFVRNDLAKRLEDPAFRNELRNGFPDRVRHPEVSICNFFDQWGLYYRDGVIDRESFMRVNAQVISDYWGRLEPVIAIVASISGGTNNAFEQFEYLTVCARRWLARHPGGNYPTGAERIRIADRWAEEDAPGTR